MRRSPRVLLAWLAALVVALTTTQIVAHDLATLHHRAASLGPQRVVIVATRDLALGETITASAVRSETRYASEVPSAAISSITNAVGRVVAVPVLRDAIVFTGNVAPADRTGLDGVIPLGDRAVHVTPKDGYRPPQGSVVDVLAAFDPTAVTVEGAGDSAVVVASGARVLAVDDAASSDTGDASDRGGHAARHRRPRRASIAFAAATADLTLAVTPPESACCAGTGS